jgi:hypothetical protein
MVGWVPLDLALTVEHFITSGLTQLAQCDHIYIVFLYYIEMAH